MDPQRQVDEIQALRSIYPDDEGCFVMSPAEQQALEAALEAVAAGVDGARLQLPGTLSGTVRLPGVLLAGQPVALRFQLPPGYPTAEPPLLSVQCSSNRSHHEQLSEAVRAAAEAAVGSESLLLVLDALQDAVAQLPSDNSTGGCQSQQAATGSTQQAEHQAQQLGAAQQSDELPAGLSQSAGSTSSSSSCPQAVLQVVIWFHHIKNTEKRKKLVAWAKELGCSGFSKPGFPGVVVVEGAARCVHEYVGRVRALQWQAMQVRGERLVPCAACSGVVETNKGRKAGKADAHVTDMQQVCLPAGHGPECRALLGQFCELPENGMSQLGQECKAAGMEDLFLAALKLKK